MATKIKTKSNFLHSGCTFADPVVGANRGTWRLLPSAARGQTRLVPEVGNFFCCLLEFVTHFLLSECNDNQWFSEPVNRGARYIR